MSALVATHVATAAASLSWMFAEWAARGKPTVLGAASGAVAGLVAITPAAGYVAPMPALVIGAIAGIVCFFAVRVKFTLGYDDALDVVGVHGVGGTLGALLTGVFASKLINPAGADGLLSGNPSQAANSARRGPGLDQLCLRRQPDTAEGDRRDGGPARPYRRGAHGTGPQRARRSRRHVLTRHSMSAPQAWHASCHPSPAWLRERASGAALALFLQEP